MANAIGETVEFVRKGDFSQTNEGQLRSTIRSLRNWSDPEAHSLIQSVENELLRRKHQESLDQGTAHHGETMKEIGEVKSAVVRLAGARWIDWAILVATAIAAAAGVILLFR